MRQRTTKQEPTSTSPKRSVITMRSIVTVTTVALIAASVLGLGSLSEKNTRAILTREIETRLVLEARNLALLSSTALLSDYPELTLHPVIKEMKTERPDLAIVTVVDHDGVIQGHAQADKLGTPFELGVEVVPLPSRAGLAPGETLLANSELVVVTTPIKHPNGEMIGKAIVGLERSHVDRLLAQARKSQLVFLAVILGLVLLVTPVLVSLLLRPVRTLRAGLERIGQGDLDIRLRLSTITELGLLASTINDMASKLKLARSELVEKERLDHEMQLARQIQRSLLPSTSMEIEDFVIAGAQQAAEEVGGDYYDVFPFRDGRIGLVVADVAGKGLGGCLVTSMIAVLIKTLSPSHRSPASLLIALQESLNDSLQPGVFVTMFYGILDPDTGKLVYASAGHNPVLHYRADASQIAWHKTEGIPLGLVRGQALRKSLADYQMHLAPGDVLVQYTDGFTEAMNPSDEEFGFERLAKVVKQCAPEGCRVVINGIQESVDRWERPATAMDDKTLLVIARAQVTMSAVRNDAEDVDHLTHPGRARPEVANQLWKRRHSHGTHFSIPAALEALDEIGLWLRRCPYLNRLPDGHLQRLEQGLYEVCANIAEHGCGLDPSSVIDVWWIVGGSGSVASGSLKDEVNAGHFLIRDHGTPPQAEEWPVPTLDSPTVKLEGRGLGLRIIYKTFEEIEFHTETTVGNITIMKFRVPEHEHSLEE